MAATNYTPIQLYYSTTATAVPLAANLAQGELAINITDGKLYYEDNAGVVQVIATKGAGTIGGSTTQIQYNNAGALAGSSAMVFNNSTNVVTLTTLNLTNALGATYGGTAQSTYAQGDILYASAANTLSKLTIGAADYILTSSGTVPQWSAPTAITVATATNLAGGLAGSVPYQSAAATTTFLGIGAANRVMTSTGTAPQWVTSLTGLTGVSSSSITNTSLTVNRVVVSGTGGLQVDDADLTFDGTTLSAGGFSTVGLSSLVKTVKIGDSSFNGVAVFAAATPAKLYLGTGTVTDTTSAIGATNAVGAVASLDITPIAATNTSVTYTNAATLYIAGAPSAGTNVTLTNPYALYVNGGASYFGGAVDFAVTPSYSGGTANGVMYLNGSKQITTGAALTFSGTNLGVGTSSPAGLLDVSGTEPVLTASQSSVTVLSGTLIGAFNAYSRDSSTTSTGGVGGIRIYASAEYNTSNTPSYMSFFTHDTSANDGTLLGNPIERMRLDALGNLGLGGYTTAYNNAKLTVVTNAVSGRQTLSAIDKTTANWVRFTNPEFSTNSSMGLILKSFPDSDSRQGAGIIASGGATNNSTNLSLFVTDSTAVSFAAYTATPDGANLGHTWSRSASSDSMTLDSGGNWMLGVSTAFTRAQIAASKTATSIGSDYNPGILNIQNASATNGNLSLIGFQDASAFVNLAAMGAINTTHSGSPNNVVGELAFYTKAAGGLYISEKMRITSAGRVGVNTTAPGSLLEVVGVSPIDTTGSSGAWTLRLRDTTATALAGTGSSLLFQGIKATGGGVGNYAAIAGLKENNTDNNENGYLGFFTVSNSNGLLAERGRFTSAGNLILGTVSDQNRRLQVSGTIGLVDAALNSIADMSIDSNGVMYISPYNGSGSSVVISTNPSGGGVTKRMQISSNGQVGIGNITPGQSLDVDGNIRSRDGGMSLSVGTTQQGVFCTYNRIFGSGTDYTPTIFAETGLGVTFAVNGTSTKAMSLTSSGILLVGQTSSTGGRVQVTTDSTRLVSSANGVYRVFTQAIQKSSVTTHTCDITFESQGSNHVSHIVEVFFAAAQDNANGGVGGSATYVLGSLTGLSALSEIQDIGTGVSFAANTSGMVLTITATTTSARNAVAWTVKTTSTNSFGSPLSMTIA